MSREATLSWIVFAGAALWGYHCHPHNPSAFGAAVLGAALGCLGGYWITRSARRD